MCAFIPSEIDGALEESEDDGEMDDEEGNFIINYF